MHVWKNSPSALLQENPRRRNRVQGKSIEVFKSMRFPRLSVGVNFIVFGHENPNYVSEDSTTIMCEPQLWKHALKGLTKEGEGTSVDAHTP